MQTTAGTVRKILVAAVAALTLATGLGLATSTAPASALTGPVSQKVCATKPNGAALSGATLITYYKVGTSWREFARGSTGPGGCGWVSAPRGYVSQVRVWKLLTNGCLTIGYNVYSDGYLPARLYNANSSAGVNLGTWSITYSYFYC